MPRIWGYARVSTADQNPALQIDALKAAGVPEANIVVEHVSARQSAGQSLRTWWLGLSRATR